MRQSTTDLKDFAPLAEEYAAAGRLLPEAEIVPGERVPQPYRGLLVHDRDMTSTLEAFHGGPIDLRVLSRIREGKQYRREVVLFVRGSGRPVEYGAISIHLPALPPAARKRVLEERVPLGAILHRHGVAYTSRPSAYFRLKPDEPIVRALDLSRVGVLYGRCNELRNRKDLLIARIVEILPPEK